MNSTPPRWCPNCGDDTQTAERLPGAAPQSLLCKGCGWLWTPTCEVCEWPATPGNWADPDSTPPSYMLDEGILRLPEGWCSNPHCEAP